MDYRHYLVTEAEHGLQELKEPSQLADLLNSSTRVTGLAYIV